MNKVKSLLVNILLSFVLCMQSGSIFSSYLLYSTLKFSEQTSTQKYCHYQGETSLQIKNFLEVIESDSIYK